MRKKSYTTKIFMLILILTSIKFAGCEQEDLDFFIDCDFCLEDIPTTDTLRISVTINEENPYVPLEFFKGNFEDGIADWTDTAYSEEFWLVSDVGVEYSAKATYKENGKTIVAVDGDKMTVVDGEGDCYPPCYYVRGGTLDLRLLD